MQFNPYISNLYGVVQFWNDLYMKFPVTVINFKKDFERKSIWKKRNPKNVEILQQHYYINTILEPF